MKKLSKILKIILKEVVPVGPGRPEGPSSKNQHHFHKHPKSAKGVDYYHNFGKSQNWPYDDEVDADVNVDISPGLNEFFKFTTSMEDGRMGMGSGIAQGSGAPRSYGKGKEPFGKKFSPSDDQLDMEVFDNEQKMQFAADKNSSRVKSISEFVTRGRDRLGDMGYTMNRENPHGSGEVGNKNPWTEDQIENGVDADLHALDEADYADSAYSRWSQSHKYNAKDADLHSLDALDAYEEDEDEDE